MRVRTSPTGARASRLFPRGCSATAGKTRKAGRASFSSCGVSCDPSRPLDTLSLIPVYFAGYPQAWSLADAALGDEDEDEDDADEDAEAFKPSPTVRLLFQHLTLGCSGHPTPLYPTILLILATVPASLLPPTRPALSLLFESFWAAYSSRAIALGGARAIQAWAEALLEAVLFETSQTEDPELAAAVAREWIGERLFALAVGRYEDGKVPSAARSLAACFEKPLARLAGREDRSAFEACWAAIAAASSAATVDGTQQAGGKSAALEPLASALSTFAGSANELVRAKGQELALECLRLAANVIVQASEDRPSEEALGFVRKVASAVEGPESRQVSRPETRTPARFAYARSCRFSMNSHGRVFPPCWPARPPR